MKAIIDTNILYYISGVSETIYDRKVLLEELKIFDSLCVSDISILEMMVKYREDTDTIISIINFLHDEQIEVNTILEKKYSICSKEIIDAMSEDISILKYIISDSLRVKKHIENSYMRMLIISIAIVYINIAFYSDKLENICHQQFIDNFFKLSIGIDNEKSICAGKIENALDEFYIGSVNNKAFKDKIIEIVTEICETYLLFVEVESKGVDFEKFCAEYNLNSETYKIIEDLHAKNVLTKNISDRKIQKSKIIAVYDKVKIEDCMDKFKGALNGILPSGEITYISELIKKIFDHKDSKIEKNDIIDSIYFKYVPEYYLISCDTYMRKIIKMCNEENSTIINNILAKSKKS